MMWLLLLALYVIAGAPSDPDDDGTTIERGYDVTRA